MPLLRALLLFLILTFITGFAYPLIITAIAQGIWPFQANGSIVLTHDRPVGSKLIAQPFKSDKYFWPRPSAVEYNPLPSGASNLGPTSRQLLENVQARKKIYGDGGQIPDDLLTASSSGLDPHITPQAAQFQLPRILKARNWDDDRLDVLQDKLNEMTHHRTLTIMGKPHLNVLELNLMLDQIEQQPRQSP